LFILFFQHSPIDTLLVFSQFQKRGEGGIVSLSLSPSISQSAETETNNEDGIRNFVLEKVSGETVEWESWAVEEYTMKTHKLTKKQVHDMK
jgi:hypothetical protein